MRGDARPDDGGFEWLGDIVGATDGEAEFLVAGLVLGRDENDRNPRGLGGVA